MKRSFIHYAPTPAAAATAAAQHAIEVANQSKIDSRFVRVISTQKIKGPTTKYVSIIQIPDSPKTKAGDPGTPVDNRQFMGVRPIVTAEAPAPMSAAKRLKAARNSRAKTKSKDAHIKPTSRRGTTD